MIDHHFLHPLTIQQIAQECFLSETKLKQGFKTCFNCTVYEYIVEKRMEMAYRLLQKERYKVKDVVWMVGYSNTSHFIEAFRKRYGITPGRTISIPFNDLKMSDLCSFIKVKLSCCRVI